MMHHFIRTQPTPKEPSGTIVTVGSGMAGITNGDGGSAYNISKLAEQRLGEHLQLGIYFVPLLL